MRRRFAAALLGLCGLVAGCSSSISGSGTGGGFVPPDDEDLDDWI